VLRNGELAEVEWSDVVVGDICQVSEEERFPADLILLSSAFPDGRAFIETASLDGEKNLKPRSAYPETQRFNSVQELINFRGEWKGTEPDMNLHEFNSSIKVGGFEVSFRKDKQLLYREARLKNTKWIYGLAIYTGRNSKIMMNSQGETNKMSQIE
jgi:phospholipid-transporting ATPase